MGGGGRNKGRQTRRTKTKFQNFEACKAMSFPSPRFTEKTFLRSEFSAPASVHQWNSLLLTDVNTGGRGGAGGGGGNVRTYKT